MNIMRMRMMSLDWKFWTRLLKTFHRTLLHELFGFGLALPPHLSLLVLQSHLLRVCLVPLTNLHVTLVGTMPELLYYNVTLNYGITKLKKQRSKITEL